MRDTLIRLVELAYENRHAAYYSFTCIALFALTYWVMGVDRHFDVPDYLGKRKNSFVSSALYTSVLAQNNAMPDITPKTSIARVLFMLQVTLGWLWFLVLNPKSAF